MPTTDGEESTPSICFYGSFLGSNPDISQKYKMGGISKGVAKKSFLPKKYTKGDVKLSVLSVLFPSRTLGVVAPFIIYSGESLFDGSPQSV
jgi:hypothetical protein